MVEMKRKCLANDSLVGFSNLSASEESPSHYHIVLLLRGAPAGRKGREPRRDLTPNHQEK